MDVWNSLKIVKEIAVVGIALIYGWDTLKEIFARNKAKFPSKKSTQKLMKWVKQERKLNSTVDNIPKEKATMVSFILAIVLVIIYLVNYSDFVIIADLATFVTIFATAKLTRIKNQMSKEIL